MTAYSAPATKYVTVTPSDSTVVQCRAIYVGTGGDLALKSDAAATAVTFKSVPSGAILPVSAYYIMSTNTTASNIVALY